MQWRILGNFIGLNAPLNKKEGMNAKEREVDYYSNLIVHVQVVRVVLNDCVHGCMYIVCRIFKCTLHAVMGGAQFK